MEYVTLGKTGLRVSRMGLGGIPIQKIDAEGTKTLLHKLADRGVNYIDTARGYTVSEEYLGATKPATVETGAQVQVPLFVNQGDKLKIDTRTGEYLSRV